MSFTLFQKVAVVSQFSGFKVAKMLGFSVQSNLCDPSRLFIAPVNTSKSRFVSLACNKILFIFKIQRQPQIADSVVVANSVDVVNLMRRPFTINVQPSKSVGHVDNVLDANINSSARVAVTRNILNFNSVGKSNFPSKNSSLGVVMKNFVKLLLSKSKIQASHAFVPFKQWFGQRPTSAINTSGFRYFTLPVLVLAMSGCAHKEYQAYADVHKAQAAAQTARFQALADIARQGDTTAKVAAVMSLQMGGNGQQGQQVAAPKSWSDYALQWTGLLLPTVGQIYTINKQTGLGMRQSDNATALGISTNNAFVGMAGKIQAPAANVTTIGGNGVIGSGSYTIGANSGTNSGNTGRLAGGAITDNTAIPTVVPTTTTTTTLSCTTGPC